MRDRIRLSARGWGDDAEWLPALLAAEVEMICEWLLAQAHVVNDFNQARAAWARELTTRIYPRIDRVRVMLLSGWKVMSEQRFRGEMDALWRKWIV